MAVSCVECERIPPSHSWVGGFASPHGALFAIYAHWFNSASRIPAVAGQSPPPLLVVPQPGINRGVLVLWFPLYILNTVENNDGISASGGLGKTIALVPVLLRWWAVTDPVHFSSVKHGCLRALSDAGGCLCPPCTSPQLSKWAPGPGVRGLAFQRAARLRYLPLCVFSPLSGFSPSPSSRWELCGKMTPNMFRNNRSNDASLQEERDVLFTLHLNDVRARVAGAVSPRICRGGLRQWCRCV